MRVMFRADASAALGMGHVMRCLTLAEEFGRADAAVGLMARPMNDRIRAMAEMRGTQFHALTWEGSSDESSVSSYDWESDLAASVAILREWQPDWLVVDHYGLDERWERAVRAETGKLLVIDDLANRDHVCDVLLDQTYGRRESDYANRVPSECTPLLGSQYALLRPQFRQHRVEATVRRETCEQINRVLITMGGMDNANVTGTVVDVLSNFDWPALPSVDVLLSDAAPHKSAVQQQANASPLNVTVHAGVDDVAGLILGADLAIGAGGTTTWERCCLGLPSILTAVAENQRTVVDIVDRAGAAIVIEWPESYEQAVGAAIGRVLGDWRFYHSLSRRSSSICDGLGCARVMAALGESTVLDAPLALRPAQTADCDLLFHWQVQPGVRAHSRNPEVPSYREHTAWFDRVFADPGRHIFIAETGGVPVGMLRLDQDNAEMNRAEISILVDPALHGRKIGQRAISAIQELFPNLQLIAEVATENVASNRLFRSCGFEGPVEGFYRCAPLSEM